MNDIKLGGMALNTQLPGIIPPQFSITNKIGPTKLSPLTFPTKSKTSFFSNMGGIGSLGNMASSLSSLIPQTPQSGLTTGLNAGYDSASNMVAAIPGIGTAISGAMKIGGALSDGLTTLGVGTDQMTTTDKILDSKFLKLTPIGLVNAFGAKKADTINKDTDTFEQVGSAYTGTESDVDSSVSKSGKKYGLLSSGSRRKANAQIAESKRKQNIVSGIADEAQDAFSSQRSSLGILNNRNQLNLTGGYKSKGMYVGKSGLKFPTSEEIDRAKSLSKKIKDTPVPEFKEGGKMNVIPDGALHARKNNMEMEEITSKGIPVITQEDGGIVQHAEIERNEIIFTKEVTEELERLYKDGSDEAAIEAGKLIAKQIMENTRDNTGLISEVKI